MNIINLKLTNELLEFGSEPPYITSGNKGIDRVTFTFDNNWTLSGTTRYLYVIRNENVIDKFQIINNQCDLSENVLREDGYIYFCVLAIDTNETVVKTSSRLKFKIQQGIDRNDIIKEYPEIRFYRGCASTVNFDFSNFNFYEGTVELTIKRKPNTSTLFTYTFDTSEVYSIVFNSAFTGSLSYSDYVYDLVYVVESERYPLCVPSKITVMEMVNNG